jgi:hypothetical protein
MFLTPLVTLAVLLGDLRRRATERLAADNGSITLEQAVIASVLFLGAVALGAVIVRAVTTRAGQIQ